MKALTRIYLALGLVCACGGRIEPGPLATPCERVGPVEMPPAPPPPAACGCFLPPRCADGIDCVWAMNAHGGGTCSGAGGQALAACELVKAPGADVCNLCAETWTCACMGMTATQCTDTVDGPVLRVLP